MDARPQKAGEANGVERAAAEDDIARPQVAMDDPERMYNAESLGELARDEPALGRRQWAVRSHVRRQRRAVESLADPSAQIPCARWRANDGCVSVIKRASASPGSPSAQAACATSSVTAPPRSRVTPS